MPPSIGPLTVVLALGSACGLNLYATVAMLGLGAGLGWIGPLPPELRGLGHPLVVGAAVAFVIIEAVAERTPYIDSLWAAIHIVIKPVAAALLVVPFLGPAPGHGWLPLAALGAAALALLVHAGRGVVSATLADSSRRLRDLALYAGQTGVAVALILFFESRRHLTLGLVAVVLLWTAAVGPRAWRLLSLTLLAQVARLRAAIGYRNDWRDSGELPGRLRALLPPHVIGQAPVRATRAGLRGLPGVGAYRNGWLVLGPGFTTFLFRSLLGARSVPLPPATATRLVPGAWIDTLEIDSELGSCAIFLLKDGPHPELALADLSPGSP